MSAIAIYLYLRLGINTSAFETFYITKNLLQTVGIHTYPKDLPLLDGFNNTVVQLRGNMVSNPCIESVLTNLSY
jgi:hypothetical protein